jgi:hypothetical protein
MSQFFLKAAGGRVRETGPAARKLAAKSIYHPQAREGLRAVLSAPGFDSPTRQGSGSFRLNFIQVMRLYITFTKALVKYDPGACKNTLRQLFWSSHPCWTGSQVRSLLEDDLADSGWLQELCLWGIGLNYAGFLDVAVHFFFLSAGFRLRSRMPEVEVAG